MLEDETVEEDGIELMDDIKLAVLEVELATAEVLKLIDIDDVTIADEEMEEDSLDMLDWEVLLAREEVEDLEGDGSCCLHVPKPVWQPSPQ